MKNNFPRGYLQNKIIDFAHNYPIRYMSSELQNHERTHLRHTLILYPVQTQT